ncbi:hypothetical protein DMUE_5558 [Dictyocoela muelleri]|nr:hypothetical protein DMUE_5558 [Dictyocoela muelleri]
MGNLLVGTLILKFKKIPKYLNSKVLVDLNSTGIWSVQLTSPFIERNILSIPETMFAREPVLLIMDSFSAHLKLIGKYEKYNVFISFIPKCMTPLLQMLDVPINRSFQQFYGDCINEYIKDKIEDETNRRNAGNIKKPSYSMVSDICFNFSR